MPRLEHEQPLRQELVDYMAAADLMGVPPGVLLRWLREGEFPGERLRVKWHITITELAGELGTTPEELRRELDLEKRRQ